MTKAKVKLECIECCGTGVSENIGGYSRICDVCRGEGDIFISQMEYIDHENNERMLEAITSAVNEVIAEYGIESLKALSMFNSKDNDIIAGKTLNEWQEFARMDQCLDVMVPSDLRQLVGVIAYLRQDQKLVKDKIIFAIGEYMLHYGLTIKSSQHELFHDILSILKGNN